MRRDGMRIVVVGMLSAATGAFLAWLGTAPTTTGLDELTRPSLGDLEEVSASLLEEIRSLRREAAMDRPMSPAPHLRRTPVSPDEVTDLRMLVDRLDAIAKDLVEAHRNDMSVVAMQRMSMLDISLPPNWGACDELVRLKGSSRKVRAVALRPAAEILNRYGGPTDVLLRNGFMVWRYSQWKPYKYQVDLFFSGGYVVDVDVDVYEGLPK